MAGLAYSSLLYATKRAYYHDANSFIQTLYVMGSVASMYLALRAMTGTTMIAMFAPGKALRGPDGSMHETVDGMLEEFETAGISFQGCLYSFVSCLLAYAWSEASPSWLCVLLLTAMALVISHSMRARTSEVETTFPLYSIPLVSGAFFSKERNRRRKRPAQVPAHAQPPVAASADQRPATRGYDSEARHGAGTSHHGYPLGGQPHWFPERAAGHTAGRTPPAITPASPRDVAVRYAEQRREQRRVAAESRSPFADESSEFSEPTPLRLVTEARARLNHGLKPPRLSPLLGGSWRARATASTTTISTTWGAREVRGEVVADKDSRASTRRKVGGRWFHRLRVA